MNLSVDIERAGGVGEAICLAMNKHIDVPSMLICGAVALCAMFSADASLKAIVGPPVVAVLAQGMRTHSKDPEVLHGCMRAFNNLCVNSQPNKAESHRENAIKLGLDAMEDHPDNPCIQEWACRLLSTLCNCREAAKSLTPPLQARMLPLLQLALQRHWNQPRTTHWARKAAQDAQGAASYGLEQSSVIVTSKSSEAVIIK